MKVLAINSSPNMDKGNTALILNPFLNGMRDEGADIDIFYTKKLKINPCQGEFDCWFKTPGQCFQKDDMQILIPKLGETDILVLATPLYSGGMSGSMKTVLDRMIPLALPFFELRDGHCRHPSRNGHYISKLVLVSNCGFWEKDNFNALLAHMEEICKNKNCEFAGALLRPHGPMLGPMLEMEAPVNDVLQAASEAGRQLIRDGRMDTETLNIVSRELLPLEMELQIINQSFQQRLGALVSD